MVLKHWNSFKQRAYALSSYALTYVALGGQTTLRSAQVRSVLTMSIRNISNSGSRRHRGLSARSRAAGPEPSRSQSYVVKADKNNDGFEVVEPPKPICSACKTNIWDFDGFGPAARERPHKPRDIIDSYHAEPAQKPVSTPTAALLLQWL